MKIFVHQDRLYRESWHDRFVYALRDRYGVETQDVDLLEMSVATLAQMVARDDGLVGRFGHVARDLATFGAIADNVATIFGGRIFPAPHTYLYYDNKARQAALFHNRGYPTPTTAVVSSRDELEAFMAREGLSLPIVIKAFHGAASSAVRLLIDLADAKYPCVAQRYCPGNPCDYRVCVIGHRVMGFRRRNRKDDFRASGSHDIVHVDELDPRMVALAYRISTENHFESMAYDFVRLRSQWVVLEMTYSYPHTNLRNCAFYYDMRTGQRVAKAGVYPEEFIIEDFIGTHYPQRLPRERRGADETPVSPVV